MPKNVVSARGEKVDFDLMGIKSAIGALPITENVANRERFINKKRRRGMKRRIDEMAQATRQEANEMENSLPEVPVDTDAPSEKKAQRRKIK